MRSIHLGTTGIQAAELGFGAMYLPRITAEQSDALIERALERGISYFDTASAYQDSEEKLGRVLSKTERPFAIASRSINYKAGLDAFRKDFSQSFERLNLPVIDFYGFHAVNQPPDFEAVMGEPLAFLKEQKAKGRIRHIAITSHNPKMLDEALRTGEFEMAMFPFNIIEREPLEGLLQTAAALGVATAVMKPLAGGVITSVDLALRFFFSHAAGVIAPGMMSVDQLEQNLRIFNERRTLSPGERERLEASVAELGKDFCRRCSYCMPCPAGIMIPFVHMLHMKTWGRPMSDERAYMLKLAKTMLPALGKCTGCGTCIEKCPYDINTPARIRQMLEMLQQPAQPGV